MVKGKRCYVSLLFEIGLCDMAICYLFLLFSSLIRKYKINKAIINHKTKLPSSNNPLSWKGYYGIRNNGDIIIKYGTRINFICFKLSVYRACIKEYLFYLFTRNPKFK